jgi:hypothetical protein
MRERARGGRARKRRGESLAKSQAKPKPTRFGQDISGCLSYRHTLKIRSRADDGQSTNGAPSPTNIDSTNESPMSKALEYTSCNTVSQVCACVSNSRTHYDKAGRIARGKGKATIIILKQPV